MEYTERMLLRRCCSEAQIQVELIAHLFARDRRSSSAVCLGLREDERTLIRVASPLREDTIRKLGEPRRIRAAQTDDTHRPLHDACLTSSKPGTVKSGFTGACHREGIVTTLEVLMCEDGVTDDRKVCIGPDEIMRN